MHSFEQLEHTADALVRARGDSLAELLVGCAEGMNSVLLGEGAIRAERSVPVELEAADAEELVYAWLRELLFLFSAEGLVFGRFEFAEATPMRVRAIAHGEAFDPARHHGGTEIKAVTYHQFRVEQGAGGWVAEVLFDI